MIRLNFFRRLLLGKVELGTYAPKVASSDTKVGKQYIYIYRLFRYVERIRVGDKQDYKTCIASELKSI